MYGRIVTINKLLETKMGYKPNLYNIGKPWTFGQ